MRRSCQRSIGLRCRRGFACAEGAARGFEDERPRTHPAASLLGVLHGAGDRPVGERGSERDGRAERRRGRAARAAPAGDDRYVEWHGGVGGGPGASAIRRGGAGPAADQSRQERGAPRLPGTLSYRADTLAWCCSTSRRPLPAAASRSCCCSGHTAAMSARSTTTFAICASRRACGSSSSIRAASATCRA